MPLTHDDLGLLLAMVRIGWADQQFSKDELDLIRAEISDQGLDETEATLVHRALVQLPSTDEIKSFLTSQDARKAALAACYAIAFADESLALSELRAVEELASAFGVDDKEHAAIRAFAESQVMLARSEERDEAFLLENMILR